MGKYVTCIYQDIIKFPLILSNVSLICPIYLPALPVASGYVIDY